jgi:uncharacterized protein DUF3883
MSASSNERSAILAKLETKQVQLLLLILAHSELREIPFIEADYRSQALNFRETAQFLGEIQWSHEREGKLYLTSEGERAAIHANNETEIRNKLTETIVGETSPFRLQVADYLSQFGKSDSGLVHQPSLSKRLEESPLRNFMMDLRLVAYRAGDDSYQLEDRGIELYVWAKATARPGSREQHEKCARRREKLGFDAELAALEFERRRVGTENAFQVEHISATNPFASYDIKSRTLDGDQVITRYIEVKACPAHSCQFYWTASELDVARLLGSRYFLYLLPVAAGSGFDLDRMLIVQDPISSVHENRDEWLVEENVIVCKRIK